MDAKSRSEFPSGNNEQAQEWMLGEKNAIVLGSITTGGKPRPFIKGKCRQNTGSPEHHTAGVIYESKDWL